MTTVSDPVSDPLAAAMAAADPVATRAPADPGLAADLEAAWNRVAATPALPAHPARRRRRTLVLVTTAVAVAAAVGVPLALPSTGPVTVPYARAVTLDQLEANARAVSGPVLQTTTMRQWTYGGVRTAAGPAYYRADSTVTRTLGPADGFSTVDDGAPIGWLTASDAARGATVPADQLPAVGTTRESGTSTWPSASAIAALPDDPDGLFAAVPRSCSGPVATVCVVSDVLPVVTYPGTTAAQRAAALQVLAARGGATVLGPQDVGGHPGIALRFAAFPLESTAVTMVFDATDGSVLSTTYVRTAASPDLYPVPVGAVVGASVRVF